MANSLITKEQAQAIIENNDIKTPQDIMGTLKSMFNDVLQEMLESEMDETLGYERYDHEQPKNNYRNGYSHKKVHSSLGKIDIDVPRDRKSELNSKSHLNVRKISLILRNKLLTFMLVICPQEISTSR